MGFGCFRRLGGNPAAAHRRDTRGGGQVPLIHTGGKFHTSPWGGGERIAYINVMNRISIDCGCDGNPHEPDIHDIGTLASTAWWRWTGRASISSATPGGTRA